MFAFNVFGGGSSLSQWVFVLFFIEQSLPSSNLVERTFKLFRVDQGCWSIVCRGYDDRVEDIERKNICGQFLKGNGPILWLKQQHFPIGQPNQLSWQQSITILYVTSCKTFWEFLNRSKRRNSPSFHPSLDIFRSININLWSIFRLHCSVASLQYWTLGEHGGT